MRSLVGRRSNREIGDLTGTNAETVRRYLAGQSPSVEFLTALCVATQASPEWLLTGRGPMRQSQVRAHALQGANAHELLGAIAQTLERLIERVERLERFLQTMETRLRARRDDAPSDSPQDGASHAAPANASIETKPAPGPGPRAGSERVLDIARAVPRRPDQAAD
jgi:transcriptional regulator with XRE-family HTH domain